LCSPVHTAARYAALMFLLNNSDAAIDALDDEGRTPIWLAATSPLQSKIDRAADGDVAARAPLDTSR
jgi:hypothetical protein